MYDRRADTFYNLEGVKQIEFINGCLADGESLNSIEKNRHIVTKTIRKKFSNLGYNHNKELNQYIKIDENVNLLPKEDIHKLVIEGHKKEMTEPVKEKMEHFIEKHQNLFIDLVYRVDELESYNVRFKDMFNKCMEEKTNNEKRIKVLEDYIKVQDAVKDIKISEEIYEGVLITRSFKVYEKVLNDFIEFCGNNKSFRQQDIISQALYEFIKNRG